MIKFILFIFFLFYSFNSYGYEKIHVAVASNFIEPLNLIKKEFLKNNKTSFKISTGSTAKLFAQILNKAPIDIFLSADQSTIQKIPDNKKIKVSKFTYAIGSLIIFSKTKIDNQIKFENILLKRLSNKIVIANPKFSPYGHASKQVLESLGMLSLFENKIILASNINQVSSFIYSGNVDLGIISNSDKLKLKKYELGYFKEIPQNLYTQINQDAVLLENARKNHKAKLFFSFLKSNESKKIIQSFGYRITTLEVFVVLILWIYHFLPRLLFQQNFLFY